MSDHLSLPLHLPDEDARFEQLATLTQRVANHVLENYWSCRKAV